MLWLSILALVIGGEIWSRLRRMPVHPYPASTHWRPASAADRPGAPDEASAHPGGLILERALVPAFDTTDPMPRVESL
jgi:hypothetical protein